MQAKGDREIVLAAVKQDGQVAQSESAIHFAGQKIIARHTGLRALHEGRGHGLCGDYLIMQHRLLDVHVGRYDIRMVFDFWSAWC